MQLGQYADSPKVSEVRQRGWAGHGEEIGLSVGLGTGKKSAYRLADTGDTSRLRP